MSNDSKLGLALVAVAALCCTAPLAVALLASGATLAVLGALWPDLTFLFGAVAALSVTAVWLVRKRRRHDP